MGGFIAGMPGLRVWLSLSCASCIIVLYPVLPITVTYSVRNRRSLGTFGLEQRWLEMLASFPGPSSPPPGMSGMLVASFLGMSFLWVWLPLSFAPCGGRHNCFGQRSVECDFLSCTQLVFGCVTSDTKMTDFLIIQYQSQVHTCIN